MTKSLGSPRWMGALQFNGVEPGCAAMILELLPQLSFQNMLRPVFVAEAQRTPVKPGEPNHRPPKEGPCVASFL
jgi:hypothetical protein